MSFNNIIELLKECNSSEKLEEDIDLIIQLVEESNNFDTKQYLALNLAKQRLIPYLTVGLTEKFITLVSLLESDNPVSSPDPAEIINNLKSRSATKVKIPFPTNCPINILYTVLKELSTTQELTYYLGKLSMNDFPVLFKAVLERMSISLISLENSSHFHFTDALSLIRPGRERAIIEYVRQPLHFRRIFLHSSFHPAEFSKLFKAFKIPIDRQVKLFIEIITPANVTQVLETYFLENSLEALELIFTSRTEFVDFLFEQFKEEWIASNILCCFKENAINLLRVFFEHDSIRSEALINCFLSIDMMALIKEKTVQEASQLIKDSLSLLQRNNGSLLLKMLPDDLFSFFLERGDLLAFSELLALLPDPKRSSLAEKHQNLIVQLLILKTEPAKISLISNHLGSKTDFWCPKNNFQVIEFYHQYFIEFSSCPHTQLVFKQFLLMFNGQFRVDIMLRLFDQAEIEMILSFPFLRPLFSYNQLNHLLGNFDLNMENQAEHKKSFESELAYQILTNSNTQILKIVNQTLCSYLQRHRLALAQESILNQLIKYKICTKTEFSDMEPVEKLIILLQRPLTDVRNISEAFTLHLIVFNYLYIYDPALDYATENEREKIRQERAFIHQKLRPNQPGEMFASDIRGREQLSSKALSRDFGIFKAFTPFWAENWHRYEFTPHKYRVKINPDSPIAQIFQKEEIPFIAGPSGTAADCLEALYFLMPSFGETDLKIYLNLLAAAEIAQGHHSLHEILLTAMNMNLFQNVKKENSSYKPIWEQIDYSRSYTEFLNEEFKASYAYETMALAYPQYLQTPRTQIHNAARVLQKYIRSTSYQSLNEGYMWFSEDSPFHGLSISHTQFMVVSKENMNKLAAELGSFSTEEKNFIAAFCCQEVVLTHYTSSSSAEKISASGKILSTKQLKKRSEKTSEIFDCHSINDIGPLGNGDFVFLRFGLRPDLSPSRFGSKQFIFDGRRSRLMENGWISLFEQLEPNAISVVQEIGYADQKLRSYIDESYENNTLHFNYPKKVAEINLMATLFYGSDIMPGIGLALIRELRRIGGDFQKTHLHSLDTSALDTLLSRLFRIEAKICSSVDLMSAPYLLQNIPEISNPPSFGK